MAKILQIETATSVCSVALSVNGITQAVKEEQGQNLHASQLTLFIEELLASAHTDFSELDAISVSKGPGSYTGLRIGVSSAKGLAYALGIPLIAVETLKMMAAGYSLENPGFTGLICPMIDARRMEVYTALFQPSLAVVKPTVAEIIDDSSFNTFLNTNTLVFLGDGAEKCQSAIVHENARFDLNIFNSAKYMSGLAFEAFQKQDFVDVAYFEPFYLKDFVVTQPKKKV